MPIEANTVHSDKLHYYDVENTPPQTQPPQLYQHVPTAIGTWSPQVSPYYPICASPRSVSFFHQPIASAPPPYTPRQRRQTYSPEISNKLTTEQKRMVELWINDLDLSTNATADEDENGRDSSETSTMYRRDSTETSTMYRRDSTETSTMYRHDSTETSAMYCHDSTGNSAMHGQDLTGTSTMCGYNVTKTSALYGHDLTETSTIYCHDLTETSLITHDDDREDNVSTIIEYDDPFFNLHREEIIEEDDDPFFNLHMLADEAVKRIKLRDAIEL